MTIRLAEPADAEAIAATLREAFLPFEPLYTPAGFRATTPSADEIRARWSEGPTWVAARGEEIVGTVSAVPRARDLYVRSMAVRPVAQGSGTGRELLDAAEGFALERRYGTVALSTTPFLAAAIRLYRRQGFKPAGESNLFGTPLVLMVKEIGAAT